MIQKFKSIAFYVGILSLLFAMQLNAQQDLSKKQLEHTDYDRWSTMSRSTVSHDGNWAMFGVQNGASDGEATITFRSLVSDKQYVVERGSGARFTPDSKFALYRITPSKKQLKKLRKEKAKPSELPKAVFQVLNLESGDLTTIENVKSFQTPEENGDWVACLLEKPDARDQLKTQKASVKETYEVTEKGLKRPAKPWKLKKRPSNPSTEKQEETKSKKKSSKESKNKSSGKGEKETSKEGSKSKTDATEKKDKKLGTQLALVNLSTGVQRTFPNVTSFRFSKFGDSFAFATSAETGKKKEKSASNKNEKSSKGEKESDSEVEANPDELDGVYLIELDTLKKTKIAEGLGNYKRFAFNEDGSQLAFLSDKDDYESETPSWSLYHWKSRSKVAKKIAHEGESGIPDGWWVASGSSQQFSEDGKRLYFDTAPIPDQVLKERKTDKKEEDEDTVKLDVWHWQDPQLQPQQILQADRERRRDYRAAWILKSKKIVQLATLEIPNISIDVRSKSKLALANTNLPYQKMMSWDVPGFSDAYLVNLDTGEHDQILQKVKWFASMSPTGKYITWFDGEEQAWFAKSTSDLDGKPTQISKGIKYPLFDELHDTPSLARSYGSAGWLNDDEGLLVYDRYDIWKLDPTGEEKPVCITDGEGRKNEIRYRYVRLDREQRFIDPEQPMMLSSFNTETKASGYSQLKLEIDEEDEQESSPLTKLIMLEENVSGLSKAKDADRVIFTRSTFRMSPDLWHSDMSFKKIHRLSDMNPQQEDYSWGTAELVKWDSADGDELDGILYKPDGFDPAKKYPLMVYFYERNSDNLHRYYSPAAGRSIINFSFYTSRGYVVFIPDIPYTTGEPGQSAANAILPGVEHLIEQGFVDESKVGMQGHSWGGYQTAYLVTQTDMFACAESGAPVSNMTSAYGGIRWSSGMSRMFQYERTQSRIGEDLWSAREKYIRNSPVFYADKINTPLLILHNDQDGAVPWYQGIELFVALRRLEKPAWMLNYNGNPHWVMGDKNRRDFAIRMQQFFDHHLMDAPEPEWMAFGVPAVKKGKEFGLELLEPEVESSEENSEEANSED
ncbi:S9 family peptidase [Mariniblastus fucicola]|uniref:Prolyl tripeptidyl peptidase n=1 Tax=Mariniblastus fucicola TaxID=980251 RepID=A0A5B9P8L8_9BACT|nr:prolyl oligopeptidase family serine peptidase [Mariniblastus fucicola]QEG21555.1 Prolyl tripeptidyl peptidase precursor [Mariniblastus fucicola]